FGWVFVSLFLLHRDFGVPVLSLAASKVLDYKIPNQPPNKKWKFLYDQDKLGSYRMVIKQFSCPTCEIQKVSRWDREP
ncbi:MAG: hypothetical protein KAJ81_04400, partial [Candidatus Latescibacteria bacterium]|nr:hypothetical protein [Candidatus Latescibacterota bacterium]